MPTVSVVMPLFNSATFMERSIRSVLEQTFADFELVLVDDCSEDGSLALARELSLTDARIAVVALPANLGGGGARNAGIEAAAGRYIAFIDSDDMWLRNKLEVQVAAMVRMRAALSYTDFSVINEQDEEQLVRIAPARVSYRQMLKSSVIGCSTAIYDTQILGKRYFPMIRKRQDFALWLSILRHVDIAYKGGGVLTIYRVRTGSVSANKFSAAHFTWQVYRDVEKLPLPQAIYYFAHYALIGVGQRAIGRFKRAMRRTETR